MFDTEKSPPPSPAAPPRQSAPILLILDAATPSLLEDLTARGCKFTELSFNLQKTESLLIQRALAETRGNVAKAARLLGINRTRIYRKFHEAAVQPFPDKNQS